MKSILYLLPAYGRTYETKEDVLKDWDEGKDFRILHGPYTSIRDMGSLINDYDHIYLIYGKGEQRFRHSVYENEPRKLIDRVI